MMGVGGCAALSGLLEAALAPGQAPRVLAGVDAQTLRVRVDGREQRVRLLGISAPRGGACGATRAVAVAARALYRRPVDRDRDGLIDGGRRPRAVTLTRDPRVPDRDAAGRLLRYVRVGGSARTLQERLLAAGYASPRTTVAGHGFGLRARFAAAARTARRHHRGVWRRCR